MKTFYLNTNFQDKQNLDLICQFALILKKFQYSTFLLQIIFIWLTNIHITKASTYLCTSRQWCENIGVGRSPNRWPWTAMHSRAPPFSKFFMMSHMPNKTNLCSLNLMKQILCQIFIIKKNQRHGLHLEDDKINYKFATQSICH